MKGLTAGGFTQPNSQSVLSRHSGAIAAQAWHQITTYLQRKQKHEQEVAAYLKKLDAYNQKKRQHQHEVRAAQSPERIAEFRYKLLLNVLSGTTPHDGDLSQAKPGRSEVNFLVHLKRYFVGKIYVGLTLSIPDFVYPYTPDFAYIDPALRLHIDIEVDEPYSYKTKEPIHFLDSWRDNNRNNFFLNKGWIVIRFSEEQVVRWPKSCCRQVAEVIADVLGDKLILSRFNGVSSLQPMQRWTAEEARQMVANRYRDKYFRFATFG